MIFDYSDFIFESIISSFSKDISVDFEIEGGNHFKYRLDREDNQVNKFNEKSIEREEVISDIKLAIPQIVKRNLFSNGFSWVPKQDFLNREICITNTKTNLNILLIIRKIKSEGKYIYRFSIKTVMRKVDFIPTGNTFLIKIG